MIPEARTSHAAGERDADGIALRTAGLRDGPEIWQLVRASGVLDVNSCYAYLLLASHFADTCVVAELDGEVAGFVTAYIPPRDANVVYVWQVGVAQAARRRGLGRRMLRHLLSLPVCREVRYLETTVSPSNVASQRLFESLAESLRVPCRRSPGFHREDFVYEEHEDEDQYRIGPLERKHGDV